MTRGLRTLPRASGGYPPKQLLHVSWDDDARVVVGDDQGISGCFRRRHHRDEQRWSRTNARAVIVTMILAGLIGTVTATAKPQHEMAPSPAGCGNQDLLA